MSDWTNWSEPDATGTRFRFRMMLRPALNGGKECEDLIQLGKGILCNNTLICSVIVLYTLFYIVPISKIAWSDVL